MIEADGSIIANMVIRGWDNLVERPHGSLSLRFLIQPAIAAVIALRAGIRDARERRPAYLWAIFTSPGYRLQFLHGGWRDMRMPFMVSAILDAIYQLITHGFIYPLELLFTATLLALVPYLVLRGPVNRVATQFIGARGKA